MTHQQATMELARLCQEFGRNPGNLTPGQTRAFLRVLEGMTYERGRAAVTHLVDTWARDTFPPPGALTRAASEISFEGKGGADAYSQDGGYTPWYKTRSAAYTLWRQEHIDHMRLPVPLPGELEGDDRESVAERSERRYAAYVYNENGYRDECERVWRQMWAEGQEVNA